MPHICAPPQIEEIQEITFTCVFEGMVGPGRVELPTSRLSGVRSNHLSYEPILCEILAAWQPLEATLTLKISRYGGELTSIANHFRRVVYKVEYCNVNFFRL